MHKLVLVRHGESIWNQENRFTGWKDVDLSAKGVFEARSAGELLKKEGFVFDIGFTSVLRRAIRTLQIILNEMDLLWIPVTKTWRLNERHYGGLQGMNKSEMAAQFGEEQVLVWRRSYDTPPPAMEITDSRYEGNSPRYASLAQGEFPLTECLKDTVARALPFWDQEIAPAIRAGKRVIVVAHGNSLRALVKHLDNVADDDIVGVNIPTGIPLVYELDDDLKPLKHYYLGDPDAVARSLQSVVNQGKAK